MSPARALPRRDSLIRTVRALALLAIFALSPALAQEAGTGGLRPLTGPEAASDDAPAADWREEIKVLRIGVLAPGGSGRELLMGDPFRLHLQQTLGIPVELVPARDTRALIDAIVNARVDYARMSASSFAAGWALCRCLEPLAAPRAADGTARYHAIALTRPGAGIGRLVDLEGKSVVFSDPASVTGYLVPIAILRAQGIDTAHFFASQTHAEGPDAAIEAVVRGDHDAAFTWSSLAGDEAAGFSRGPLHRLVAQGRLSMDEIAIAWKSDPIPHPPQVVRDNLPDGLKSLLRAALFDLLAADPDAYDAAEPAFSGGFTAVTQDDYAVLLHAFAPR